MKNNKIIFFSVFVCAAIMSSLFIFHLRQAPVKTTLNNDYGLIFPVTREIKPFDLVSSDEKKFGLNDLYGHWTLMFFGFTHCAQVCPETLGVIGKAYPQLSHQIPNLQVVLISVDPARDTPASLKQYTHTFNTDFLAATGKIDEVRKLQSQLGIYSEQENGSSTNYQIQHTPSILLINPKAEWAGLIKYGLNPTELSQAVGDSVKLLRNNNA